MIARLHLVCACLFVGGRICRRRIAHCLITLSLSLVWQVLLASKLYWACPFIPFIWKRMGPVKGCVLRLGFEASYAINTWVRCRAAFPPFALSKNLYLLHSFQPYFLLHSSLQDHASAHTSDAPLLAWLLHCWLSSEWFMCEVWAAYLWCYLTSLTCARLQ